MGVVWMVIIIGEEKEVVVVVLLFVRNVCIRHETQHLRREWNAEGDKESPPSRFVGCSLLEQQCALGRPNKDLAGVLRTIWINRAGDEYDEKWFKRLRLVSFRPTS